MPMSLRDYLFKNRRRFHAEEFARRIQINPTYLSRIVNGNVIPSIFLAKKIQVETNSEVIWYELMEFCYSILEAKKENIK